MTTEALAPAAAAPAIAKGGRGENRPAAGDRRGRAAGPLAGGGKETPRVDRHGRLGRGCETGRCSRSCFYSFARVSAVLGMRRQDYFGQGSRGWLRLHEKGGKQHDVPAHHRAAAALDAYVEAGGLEGAEGDASGLRDDRRRGLRLPVGPCGTDDVLVVLEARRPPPRPRGQHGAEPVGPMLLAGI